MILYPEKAAEVLGFQEVLNTLSTYAETAEVKGQLLAIAPGHDPKKIRENLKRVEACMRLLRQGETLPSGSFRDITPWLKKVAPGNSILTQDEVHKVGLWLQSIKSVIAFLKGRTEQYPELAQLIPNVTTPDALHALITRQISPDARIRDDASPTLKSIRSAIHTLSGQVRKLVDRIHRNARAQGWSDDKQATIRNNRLVIPIIADFKGKVQGFVQDVSQSGQTLFIEPAEALPLNNEVNELSIRERNEIYKILLSLADAIREAMPMLRHWEYFMQLLERLMAQAKLAIALQAEIPGIEPSGDILKLNAARNPLLLLQKQHTVVPMSFELNRKQRVMIISGPNAGGKSVALKTAGLMQLMFQSGLPVPAEKSSVLPVLSHLMVDLGDGQSIENDLSTYTAHLSHLRHFLEHAHDNSLFLIDELGTGTDPRSGGPIAAAILESLVKKEAYGIVTTHYSDLKALPGINPAVFNASMHFNLQDFTSSFRLITGTPGSSYAFEIAARAGIPKYVLDRGRQVMGKASAGAEELMAAAARDKEETERLKLEILKEKNIAEQLRKKWEARELESKEKNKKIIEESKAKARKMLQEASQKMETLLAEVRQKEVSKQVAKSMQKEVLSQIPELMATLSEPEAPPVLSPAFTTLPDKNPEPGDWVRWLNTGAIGTVLEIQGNKLTVAIGALRTVLKRKDVICVKPNPNGEGTTSGPAEAAGQYAEYRIRQVSEATTTLDIRGLRAEPATEMINKFLDQALLAHVPYLHIIHGKGNGILRRITRDVLQNTDGVQKYADAPEATGGAGATDVWLK